MIDGICLSGVFLIESGNKARDYKETPPGKKACTPILGRGWYRQDPSFVRITVRKDDELSTIAGSGYSQARIATLSVLSLSQVFQTCDPYLQT